MNLVSLTDDLNALAVAHPAVARLVSQLDELASGWSDFSRVAAVLRQIGEAARLDCYGQMALLLKADAQLHAADAGQWTPWQAAERFDHALGAASGAYGAHELALLILEQCALSCHVLGHKEVAALGERHAHERALLAAALDEEDRHTFLADKRSWLQDEVQLDWLLQLRQQLVEELEATRATYLVAVGEALVEFVEAAHRIVLMRYRVALNDPTLTAHELALRLRDDLAEGGAVASGVQIEPELRRALLDTIQGVQGDRATLHRLAAIWSQHEARTADDEDRKLAALLFRRLARMIHPDALESHPDFGRIAAENRQRLQEIWYQASATHGTRAFLSQQKLIDYVEHLRGWIAEAERIMRSMAFHAPSRLLMGQTIAELQTDLERAMADVQRHLHAVRNDIAALEFDPQHEHYRRVIAMSDAERDAEREQMRSQAQRWNQEARRLATELNDRLRKDDDSGDVDPHRDGP